MITEEGLPPHECSLTIEHNPNRDCYETVEEWLEEVEYEWRDDESMRRAIETEQLWAMRVYPYTPIGFYMLAAPTLAELMKFVEEYNAN